MYIHTWLIAVEFTRSADFNYKKNITKEKLVN